MDLQQEACDLLRALIKIEETVARLYQAYAEKFPEYEEFWTGLVMEQIDHSNVIHARLAEAKKGSVHFSRDKVSAEAIQTFSNLADKSKSTYIDVIVIMEVHYATV